MSKFKIQHKSPRIDMTPMVDLFFLLLTFFMLTTSFKPQEAAQVDTPTSISESMAKEKNVFTLYITKDSKVFFDIDNGPDSTSKVRAKLLKDIGDYYKITPPFTQEELNLFEKRSSFGMPIKDIKAWLAAESADRDKYQTGIPMDSTDNQLALWIHFARLANEQAEADIKGDSQAEYKVVKKVMDLVQDKGINKFNLTTTLKAEDVKPENIN